MTTLARHLLAAAVTVVIPVTLAVALYGLLLAVALLTGEGLGGPLALPGMVLLTLGFSVASTLLLIAPSVLAAERVSRSWGDHRWIGEVLLSSLCLLVAMVALSLVASALKLTTAGLPRSVGVGLIWWLALLLPLGLYWWVAKAPQWVFHSLRSAVALARRRFHRS